MPPSKPLVFVDGKLSASQNLPASVLNETEVNVFESLRVFGGKIFQLEEHLNRLFESAKTVHLKVPRNREEIAQQLKSILKQTPAGHDVFLRITVIGKRILIFLTSRSWPEDIYRRGVDLRTSVARRSSSNAAPPESKSNQFLNGVLATLNFKSVIAKRLLNESSSLRGAVNLVPKQSKDGDCFSTVLEKLRNDSKKAPFAPLFLSPEGYVLESDVWNIFIARNKTLMTPPAAGILNGVTRRFVIKCAQCQGFQVRETSFTRHDVFNADEGFLTNTSGEIVPVRSLDHRQIGTEIPGKVTRQLKSEFEEFK